ncbi:MAG: RagB/SusD family nutrient uptake outer membrane protein [Bacteroidales bacterium]|nr:RagB/SusD family nutrient uptake outer membrane protein [Candidatus Equibacterium intestinale]
MKKIFYALMLTALFTAVSCTEDILEQTPTNRYTDAQVWDDPFLIESHLANLYAMSTFMVNDALATYGDSPLNVDFSSAANWNYNLGMSVQGEGPLHTTELADEAKASERGEQTNYHSYKMNGIQQDSSCLRWWSNGYYLNRQLNHFIESVEDSPLSDKDWFKSEARFLRAYNYFSLVKRYGGVPLIEKEIPLDAPDEVMYPARAKEQAVWDFVIKELQECAEFLPAKATPGRASKWAALTLLSRVALYAGSIAQYGTVQLDGVLGIPSDKAEYYYNIAADAAQEVMTKSGHALYNGNKDKVQNLKDLFLVKDNVEAIMVKRHQGIAGQQSVDLWSWDICNCPKPNAWSVGQYLHVYYEFVEEFDFIDGKSGHIPAEELQSKPMTMDEFMSNRDPRLRAWVWTNGWSWPGAVGAPVFNDNTVSMYRGIRLPDGTDVIPGNVTGDGATYDGVMSFGDQMYEMVGAALLNPTGFCVAKCLDPDADNGNWFICSTTDYQIFRYAEVLLNFAEACFELGRPGEARDAVNKIRSRAGVAELDGISRDAIRKERYCELCFENHRYWDLRRWRIAEEKLSVDHHGLNFLLDWNSFVEYSVKNENGVYETRLDGNEQPMKRVPKFWFEITDERDSKTNDPVFPAKNYYLPIGNGTVAANPNLVENPGY